jgi:hypothetical protein
MSLFGSCWLKPYLKERGLSLTNLLGEYGYNHLDARIFRRYNSVDARDIAEGMRKLFESELRRLEERLPEPSQGVPNEAEL